MRAQGGEGLPVKGDAYGTAATGFAVMRTERLDHPRLRLWRKTIPDHWLCTREQFIASRAAWSLATEGRTSAGMLGCAHGIRLRMRR